MTTAAAIIAQTAQQATSSALQETNVLIGYAIQAAITCLSWGMREEQHELILDQVNISKDYLEIYDKDWEHYLAQYVDRERTHVQAVSAVPAATIRHDRAKSRATAIVSNVIVYQSRLIRDRIRHFGMNEFDTVTKDRVTNHSWGTLMTDLCNNRDRYEEHRKHIEDNRRWKRWLDVYQIGLKKEVQADSSIATNFATMDAVASQMGDALGDISTDYAQLAGYLMGRDRDKRKIEDATNASKAQFEQRMAAFRERQELELQNRNRGMDWRFIEDRTQDLTGNKADAAFNTRGFS